MQIQPNSIDLRRFIPTQTYFTWMEEQRTKSYIGLPLKHVAENEIDKRIQELAGLEQKGFVYVGEKNWLHSYLKQGKSKPLESYDHWVYSNFEQYLGLKFKISDEYDHLDYKIWCADLDASKLLLGYSELHNPVYLEIDELEILIGGHEHAPNPAHLIKAFECLHNLEYTVSTLSPKSSTTNELSITGIDISNPLDPCRWELGVISEYGGDMEKTVINGLGWRNM